MIIQPLNRILVSITLKHSTEKHQMLKNGIFFLYI